MDNKSLEGKLAEFKEIVNKISDPDIDIDESVKLFESGVKLSKDIEEKLEEYELKVKILSSGEINEQA